MSDANTVTMDILIVLVSISNSYIRYNFDNFTFFKIVIAITKERKKKSVARTQESVFVVKDLGGHDAINAYLVSMIIQTASLAIAHPPEALQSLATTLENATV